ncbi:MAG: hypothetical protein LBR19_09925 [Bifidobacteriaceae bacterium]|jgi:hypothetical protein|nr:hypothetical protein [Bifidobacteriaceae bacterium]
MDSPLQFSDAELGQWDGQAAQTMTEVVASVGDGVRSYYARGRCPRCDHATVAYGVLDSVVLRGSNAGGATWGGGHLEAGWVPGRPVQLQLRCNCDHTHPDGPEGIKGCGAEFNLTTQARQAITP